MRLVGRPAAARIAFAAAVLVLSSCSTAPKKVAETLIVRNQGADFLKLGDSFFAAANLEGAVKYYREALKSYTTIDYLEGVSSARASLGRVYLAAGDSKSAEREYQESLEYAAMSGKKSAEAVAYSGLGEVLYARGDKKGSLELFEKAVALAQGSEKPLAVALHDRAVAKTALGLGAEALADLNAAANLNQKLARWTELAANRYVLASILAGEAKYEDALNMILQALEADKAAENGRGIAGDLTAAASLARKLGRKEEAWGYLKRAFDAALATNELRIVRASLVSLISLSKELQKKEEGERFTALLKRLDESLASAKAGSSEQAAVIDELLDRFVPPSSSASWQEEGLPPPETPGSEEGLTAPFGRFLPSIDTVESSLGEPLPASALPVQTLPSTTPQTLAPGTVVPGATTLPDPILGP
jgi:tetratricopeptide (TPR) repeat protein